MANKLFNTPFELSLHVLILLSLMEKSITFDRIVAYDFISVYSNYFGFNNNPLNGENSFSFGELPVKRSKLSISIKNLVRDGLVIAHNSDKGMIYTISTAGSKVAQSLVSEYAIEYRKVASQIMNKYKGYSDLELLCEINNMSTKVLWR